VGQVGPNGQERSGSGRLGRMASGPILGNGNGVGLGCHGNRAEMRFGLRAKIEIALQIFDSRKWDSNQKF
jgi:hypothetical protein